MVRIQLPIGSIEIFFITDNMNSLLEFGEMRGFLQNQYYWYSGNIPTMK